jgi:hypothetical protein
MPIAATASGANVGNVCDRPLTNRPTHPPRLCLELKPAQQAIAEEIEVIRLINQ